MKEKINAVKELFGFVGVFFLLTILQIWYILTGNE
tara:strand:+ start:1828 stop:1932 length:105 start_codon:yes stop_codon:yes gene_type:complete